MISDHNHVASFRKDKNSTCKHGEVLERLNIISKHENNSLVRLNFYEPKLRHRRRDLRFFSLPAAGHKGRERCSAPLSSRTLSLL